MHEAVLQAIEHVFCDPQVLVIIACTAVYGVFMGAVPGLTATMAVALLIPVTAIALGLSTISVAIESFDFNNRPTVNLLAGSENMMSRKVLPSALLPCGCTRTSIF